MQWSKVWVKPSNTVEPHISGHQNSGKPRTYGRFLNEHFFIIHSKYWKPLKGGRFLSDPTFQKILWEWWAWVLALKGAQWAQKRGQALFIIFEAVALKFSPKLKMQTLLSQKCLTKPKFIILHHL